MKRAVEIVTDTNGNILWIHKYMLSRAQSVGSTFIENYKEYRVVGVAVTEGKYGTVFVEHVVELIADRTPQIKVVGE